MEGAAPSCRPSHGRDHRPYLPVPQVQERLPGRDGAAHHAACGTDADQLAAGGILRRQQHTPSALLRLDLPAAEPAADLFLITGYDQRDTLLGAPLNDLLEDGSRVAVFQAFAVVDQHHHRGFGGCRGDGFLEVVALDVIVRENLQYAFLALQLTQR